MDFTTTALITSINNRAFVPSSQSTFAEADILQLATDELQGAVVPFLMKFRSEYFVNAVSIPIVSGQAAYQIPYRAIGGKVRNIDLVDSAGNLYDVPQIEKEDKKFYLMTQYNNGNYVFYFESNQIVLCPIPQAISGMSLRVSFYMRPSSLIDPTAAAQITAINTTSNAITVGTLPSSFSTGMLVDLINGNPMFDNRAYDIALSAINGNILTLSSLPPTLAIGDWVAPQMQSPIPQVPVELHPILAQRTAIKLLEGLGDKEALGIAQAKLGEMEANAEHLVSPRSDGNPKKLNNRFSPLRSWGWNGPNRN